ncbi:Putative MetA-pathway of phenol degradation [Spongiibacter sp. IMCC21906]|uniref:transporter n=1 Tax=Spongiibacter sp. IMCC21906 TaxID=1620392 RepID=UPI00062DD9FF|nr:transporter [Spongiibacter sp. IMCC21906]AKH67704.1 Putative MetA-pathway of phenol degradation [Spongiibacter sp. IMCC21906]
MRRTSLLLVTLLGPSMVFAHGSPNTISGSSSHAPISVMGDHTHKAGEWMLSYRYMSMAMGGNLDGSDGISSAEITGNMMNPGQYMVAPEDMVMTMHMLGAMYAPSDQLTVMAMLPWVSSEMDHVTRMGGRFTTEAAGFGDVKLSALVNVYQSVSKAHKVHLNLGLSLPTGSIDERDDTPAMANAKLPYPMQLGSGSIDVMPGMTYQGFGEIYSWGSQLMLTLPTAENDNDYQLGNRYGVSVWLARSWSTAVSTSLGLNYQYWQNIDGAREDLNPNMVPTADPDARAGQRADLSLGLNYLFIRGSLKGHRLALEYSQPIFQRLDGPHMELESTLTLGWQYAF